MLQFRHEASQYYNVENKKCKAVLLLNRFTIVIIIKIINVF